MNIIKLSTMDTANGKGIGAVLWVAGCSHHCKGCHNPETWNAEHGRPFTQYTIEAIINAVKDPWVKRLTLSGGDPLYTSNREPIHELLKEFRAVYPMGTKQVWLYTGYLWEDIRDLELLDHVDVLVDGEYIQELKDLTLPFCGSKNQRIIDVQESLRQGKAILYNCD